MNKANAGKLALLLLIVGGAAYYALRQRPARPLAIGDRALDFSVPALPSGSLEVKNYRGQVVLLNFWATWCPPCVEETPSLVQFAAKMRDHGVVVIGVSVDQDPKALEDFMQKFHIPYPVGRDPDRTLAARYGTRLFPETYVFDRQGRLAEKIAEGIDWSDPRVEAFVLDLARR
jgi:peroxiredoxin